MKVGSIRGLTLEELLRCACPPPLLPYLLSGDDSLVTPCFSPDTELIRGRELTLFKLTTPSVPSTGHTVVSPPSLATSFCHLSSQPYTHPTPSLPPGFPICVPAPCSFPCGRASVPAPHSPFLIRSLSYGHVPVGPPALEHGKHCRADWGPVFSSLIAPQALLTVSSVGFSLISLKLCAVSQGCFNEPHFFRTNCSSSSQHIGAPGFSLFSAALTPTPTPTPNPTTPPPPHALQGTDSLQGVRALSFLPSSL